MRTQLDPVPADAVAQLADIEIVRRVLDGDTALFELIVRRYNQRLFRAARAILRDDGEAEDVMQETYLRAFIHLDQFAGDAKFSTWITKIAVYEALGRIRRSRSHADLPDDLMNSCDNPERAAYSRELQTAMESAIDSLPPLYRGVFALRELEEMSVAETADCLGITEESVKTRFHRARALLRKQLERSLGTAAPQAFSYLGHRCDRMTSAVMQRIAMLTAEENKKGT